MDQPALWQYIPISTFEAPSETGPEAVRLGLRHLVRRLRNTRSVPETPRETEDRDLRSAPERMLDWAASAPEWERLGMEGLERALSDWTEADPAAAGVRMVVHIPNCTTRRTVLRWSRERKWRLLTPPSPEQVLDGGDTWLEQLHFESAQRLVIPDLEKYYLRQYNGLLLIRRLLDRIWSEHPPLLMVCSSWAWAYLVRVLHINSLFPEPVTLAPFDAPVLSTWFRELSQHALGPSFTFRDAKTGRAVLLAEESDGARGDRPQEQDRSPEDENSHSDYLASLAVHSRGNPGVAWAIWRRSLHIASDTTFDADHYPTAQERSKGEGRRDAEEDEEEPVSEKAKRAAEQDTGYTIWVRPWKDLDLPQVPPRSGRFEAFILHALLLHNGMPHRILVELLPIPASEIANALQRMRAVGLVRKEEDSCWRVTTLGYPEARAFLGREGFLVDDL